MAKATTKKPKLSPEEQMAELTRLTGSVAAISHMGVSQPFVLPGAVPTPEVVAPQPVPTTEAAATPVESPIEAALAVTQAQSGESSASVTPSSAATTAPQPATPPVAAAASAPTEQKGQKALVTAATIPASAPTEEASSEDDQQEEEAPAAIAVAEGKDKLDYTSLFAESSDKKTFQVRITANNQQFFQQVGLLLGGGASSTDVIHNILAQFRAANEVQIQKALQRELRQMMSPKK